jgi:hypothetical protein
LGKGLKVGKMGGRVRLDKRRGLRVGKRGGRVKG